VPTERDSDGLALSSRNVYLTPVERTAARALPDALNEAAVAISAGESVENVLQRARAKLEAAGFGPIDYIELCDAASLRPVREMKGNLRLLAAAKLGRARLIDNVAVDP